MTHARKRPLIRRFVTKRGKKIRKPKFKPRPLCLGFHQISRHFAWAVCCKKIVWAVHASIEKLLQKNWELCLKIAWEGLPYRYKGYMGDWLSYLDNLLTKGNTNTYSLSKDVRLSNIPGGRLLNSFRSRYLKFIWHLFFSSVSYAVSSK